MQARHANARGCALAWILFFVLASLFPPASRADGIDCSYICHIAVLPNYQGLGLGKSIVSKLVELSKGHNKIILYSNPGKEDFYRKLGFKRMSTAMAIFENQDQALELGFINET
jgi:ribosomal protein S18 acetylase RimI-like enzyme